MISFKSKVTVKILGYFFINPEAKHYINELAKKLAQDPKNLYRKLREMEKEGLLQSEFRGRERYYCLAKNFPLLDHYRDIFQKTYGIEHRLREIIKNTRGVREAYVFGSYAREKMDASSDIDILAIGDHSVLDLQKRINGLQKETGREFNAVSLSKSEYVEKKRKKDQFLKNIFAGRVIKL